MQSINLMLTKSGQFSTSLLGQARTGLGGFQQIQTQFYYMFVLFCLFGFYADLLAGSERDYESAFDIYKMERFRLLNGTAENNQMAPRGSAEEHSGRVP